MRPTDDDFDDMHHALGRPKDPTKESHRNHYCTAVAGATAKRFEALGFWEHTGTINNGRDAFYSVNDAGRKALAKWLDLGPGRPVPPHGSGP